MVILLLSVFDLGEKPLGWNPDPIEVDGKTPIDFSGAMILAFLSNISFHHLLQNVLNYAGREYQGSIKSIWRHPFIAIIFYVAFHL